MKVTKITNDDIAKFIGQTPRNINLSYENKPKKTNHYYCLQIGTLLHLRGIEIDKFLYFIDMYDALKSEELRRLKEVEDKYNKILGIANAK